MDMDKINEIKQFIMEKELTCCELRELYEWFYDLFVYNLIFCEDVYKNKEPDEPITF